MSLFTMISRISTIYDLLVKQCSRVRLHQLIHRLLGEILFEIDLS